MRRLSYIALLALSLTSCGDDSRGGNASRDASQDRSTPGLETGAGGCAVDTDCDDGVACTNDACGVGGTCRNRPDNALCSGMQICSPVDGCTDGCETDADCDDDVFCNGTETCVASQCYTAMEADCDDGNACTLDRCDPDIDGCAYETAPGCDAGTGMMTMAGPFDPTMHYTGGFIVAPAPSLGCSSATYSFGSVTFSRAGSSLRVQAGALSLTQDPAPDGAMFDVRFSRPGCADYRMQGEFTDSDTFRANWSATMTGGSCTLCPNQNQMIFASRSDS